MRLVFGAKTCQLHPNQVFQRDKPNSIDPAPFAKFRCRFDRVLLNPLSSEQHMNCAAGRRPVALYQHIHTGGVPIFPAITLDRRFDTLQIAAPNNNIYIFSRTSRIRRRFFYIKKRGESADYSIVDPGLRKGLVDKMR